MVHDADELLDNRGRVLGNRITRVGRFLRKTSLDELPQLLNIVRGEMSFVGPRPILPEHLGRYEGRGELRFRLRPGITGLAQVNGRNTIPWSRRVALDVEYVEQFSLALDLRIWMKTFVVVSKGSGVVMDRNPEVVDDLAGVRVGGTTEYNGRVEPRMQGAFRKDAAYEDIMTAMNASLAGSHDAALEDMPETHATIHVIGAPRSGTTLMTQLLASQLDVGYVNNLVAAFWRAPVYGIHLSKKLMPEATPMSFASRYGRTDGIAEPHEFGYFWCRLLGYSEMRQRLQEAEGSVDWDCFHRQIVNMTHAFGKPMVFKSFLLSWHLRRVAEVLSRSCFVWVRRDPVENALSLLEARRQQLGSVDQWVSLKPLEYEWLRSESPEVQVAGQVFFLEKAIREQSRMLDSSRLVEINHTDLCGDAAGAVASVAELLNKNGETTSLRGVPTPSLNAAKKLGDYDPAERRKVERAVERFFTEIPHQCDNNRAA
ncbi:Undecaprenyl phosphate N,N'-diacetylbacillosamine 1-phosphate transferase [Planctomycetes bacterium K2D]|uniref:Undecaprenyl phosphate N,N'-diacetylbacillosamine 1-phosphate transferase n=2 Tax=Botrimarina mediterranea TaxID=2528022 RepID=A0A518KBL0_9BACT|nr:Undecaprenyl phosphate N,N'-diacetylbacillosamine 1-phosphate transferase [Botrimarina mediterranea]QDV79830.1 Undecaprenyl phosphate N,N'-diacetylbacillosamine 1-phosphate transferase [Planctomycetes bacterium K2D]